MPERFRNLYIHKKTKCLIEVKTSKEQESEKVVYTILESNGVVGNIITDGVFSSDQLPLNGTV